MVSKTKKKKKKDKQTIWLEMNNRREIERRNKQTIGIESG